MKKYITALLFLTSLVTYSYSNGLNGLNTFIRQVWEKSPDLKAKHITLKINEISIKEKQGLYDLNLSLAGDSKKEVGVYNSGLGTSIDNETKSVKVGLSQKIGTGGDLSASFQNTRKDSSSTTYYSKMGFGYSQPLLKDFGEKIINYSINLAQLDLEKSDLEYQKEVNSFLQSAGNEYLAYLLAIKTLDIAEENIKSAKQVSAEIEKKVRLKIATELDQLGADIEIKKANQEYLSAEDNLKKIGAKLQIILGDMSFKIGNNISENEFIFNVSEISTFNLLENLDYKISGLDIRNREDSICYLENQRELDVLLSSALDYNKSSSSFLGSLKFSDLSFSVGVNIDMPLGNHKNEALLEKELLYLKQDKLAHEQLIKQLQQDYDGYIRAKISSQKSADNAGDYVQLANERLRLEMKKFELGLSTLTNIVDARKDVKDAQTTYYKNLYDTLMQELNLQMMNNHLLTYFGLNVNEQKERVNDEK